MTLAAAAPSLSAQQATPEQKPGLPAVQVPFNSLKPSATFKVGGTADWVLVTKNSVWVAAGKPFSIQRIDPRINKLVATVPVSGEICSGQAYGFGSLWVPVCGENPLLIRLDVRTNHITAKIPIPYASAEGGITTSRAGVWMVTDKEGKSLSEIDPATNKVIRQVDLPTGSYNPLSSGDIVWITCTKSNVLTAVDSRSAKVLASIPVGPRPRFLTIGHGSVWTLNQGDGSVTRVDIKTKKVIATIALGLPGPGGDIDYGTHTVWVSMMNFPLTAIAANSNRAYRQWIGKGGDSLRFGFNSIWLTDYYQGFIERIPYGPSLRR